jgi:hypothetical protein
MAVGIDTIDDWLANSWCACVMRSHCSLMTWH